MQPSYNPSLLDCVTYPHPAWGLGPLDISLADPPLGIPLACFTRSSPRSLPRPADLPSCQMFPQRV